MEGRSDSVKESEIVYDSENDDYDTDNKRTSKYLAKGGGKPYTT